MIYDRSNYYVMFLSEMESDRLDLVFHHPILEPVREFRRKSFDNLGSFISPPQYGLSESGLLDGEVGFLNVQHITNRGQILFEPQTFLINGPRKKDSGLSAKAALN